MAELAASLVGIISVGTKVSVALFEFASDLKSAGDDVQWLGTEISVFCLVLEDLHSTLQRAKSAGFSLTSLKNIGTVLDHCRIIIEKIQDKVEDITNKPGTTGSSRKLSLIEKVKWTFSKSKVKSFRTRLESSKLTLSVMMTGVDWALLLDQKEQTEASSEDADRQARLLHSLLLSQQFAVKQLENIEADESNESKKGGSTHLRPPTQNLSQVLNDAIFQDGLSASERHVTKTQSSSVLDNIAQNFVPSKQDEEVKGPEESRIRVLVLFKQDGAERMAYYTLFEQSWKARIEIETNDTNYNIMRKVEDELSIIIDDQKYSLYHTTDQDTYVPIDSWTKRDFEKCKERAKQPGAALVVQRPLWTGWRIEAPKPKKELQSLNLKANVRYDRFHDITVEF